MAYRKRNYKRKRVVRKKRVYRRPKRNTRRPIAKLLDIVSTKKQDTMTPAVWNGTNWTPSASVLTPTGGEIFPILWAATFRKNDPALNHQSVRVAKEIFLKGIRDDVQIETGSGMAWEWRRIVFSVKSLARHASAPDFVAYDQSYGYMRAQGVPTGAFRTALESILFKGTDPHDWLTPMAAPVDVNSVTLHSDKIVNIRSGNSGGIIGKYKHYHKFEKRMVYADSENGGVTKYENFTTDSREGLGDVYILDYLRPTVFATDTDQLLFRPNATIYWHEK